MFEGSILPFTMEVGERMKSGDVIHVMPTRFRVDLTSDMPHALSLKLKISLHHVSFSMDARISRSAHVEQLMPAFYTALRLTQAPIAKVYFFFEDNLLHATQQVGNIGAEENGVIQAVYAKQTDKVIEIDEIVSGNGVPDRDIVHIKVKQTFTREVGVG